MAKETVIENGQIKQIDEQVFDRPAKTPKQKDKFQYGRKDKILIKWLAAKFGLTFQQAKQEIDTFDNSEPDDEII